MQISINLTPGNSPVKTPHEIAVALRSLADSFSPYNTNDLSTKMRKAPDRRIDLDLEKETKAEKAEKRDAKTENDDAPKKKRGRPRKDPSGALAVKASRNPKGPDSDERDEGDDAGEPSDENETDATDDAGETGNGDFDDEADDEADTAKKAAEPSIDDVREKLKSYAKKHGRDEAMKILTKFGVKMINDLKPKQFANVIREAK